MLSMLALIFELKNELSIFFNQNPKGNLKTDWTNTRYSLYLFECIFHAESKYGNEN